MWRSEQVLLEDMRTWEPLPDETDPRWSVDPDGAGVWADLQRLVDAADASGQHGWREVAVRVFEHAASWDVYEAMQSIRHGPERAFAGPRQAADFALGLEPLMRHPRAGTRLWVARELGILRQVSSLSGLVALFQDPWPAVSEEARNSVAMLAQVHAEARLVRLSE